MTVKKMMLFLFIATCLIQWLVPGNMIWQQEQTLQHGTVFKFKTRPIDPNDPFRGKYVVLNYEANQVTLKDEEHWQTGATVYVVIKNNQEGFAEIAALRKTQPTDTDHYVKATIERIWGQNPRRLTLNYPFDRFYMEEHKAPKAEQLLRTLPRDSVLIYSKVIINQGKFALEDVIINDKSLINYVQ